MGLCCNNNVVLIKYYPNKILWFWSPVCIKLSVNGSRCPVDVPSVTENKISVTLDIDQHHSKRKARTFDSVIVCITQLWSPMNRDNLHKASICLIIYIKSSTLSWLNLRSEKHITASCHDSCSLLITYKVSSPCASDFFLATLIFCI